MTSGNAPLDQKEPSAHSQTIQNHSERPARRLYALYPDLCKNFRAGSTRLREIPPSKRKRYNEEEESETPRMLRASLVAENCQPLTEEFKRLQFRTLMEHTAKNSNG